MPLKRTVTAGETTDIDRVLYDGLSAAKRVSDRLVEAFQAGDDCGRTDPLDAVMSDEQWEAISGRADGGGFLCLWCIDKRAKERGLSFPVRLHFAGDAVYSESYTEESFDED